jgi:prepilin-type processing-associated H-X9-DG protein
MNCRINPTRRGGPPSFTGGRGAKYESFKTLDQIKQPTKILVILDERAETINDGYFAIDMSNTGTLDGEGVELPYWLVDFPANYHHQSASVSFADGHVEFHHWLETSTTPPPGKFQFPVYTSPNDQDMAWLQGHCTVRK